MAPPVDPNLSAPLCGGRYLLRRMLGEGSTATVYDALDTEKGVERAIKVLSPAFALHRDARTRFEREAATMARLRHPDIVEVFDYGLDGERFYIVMEKVQGETLMERVERGGPLRPRLAATVLQRACLALHYAHTEGVIHRDVKPHNILVGPKGMPKVTDFGLARAMHFDQNLTLPGAVMGTWAYMAPEQRYDSGNVDTRTDIYAAGATLYTVLTGKESAELSKPTQDPGLLAGIPPMLAEVIRKATRFQPEERYQTAEEMARDLAIVSAALPSTLPEEEATIVVATPERPIPVAFREFGHLAQVKDELLGARRGRRRATRAPSKEPPASKGKAAPRAAAAQGRKPPMSWTRLLLYGMGAGTLVGLLMLGALLVVWRFLLAPG